MSIDEKAEKNIAIVKRVTSGVVRYDYYPNRQVAQTWVDSFNLGNKTGHAAIVDAADIDAES